MSRIPRFLEKYRAPILSLALIFITAGVIEYSMGRSIFGPKGYPGLFTMEVHSSEQSQDSFDVYSLSHIIHGVLFYALLRFLFPRMPLRWRLVAAVVLEAAWEVLENSPIIINRYRAVTIAWGYVGDSVFNSLSDVVMVILGFLATHRFKAWVIVIACIVMELFALWLVRDNLTLNILMLTYPLDAVREWQMQI